MQIAEQINYNHTLILIESIKKFIEYVNQLSS